MKNFDLTTIQGKSLIIDISELLREEVLYINATKLAKQFHKNKQRLNEFLNSKSFTEYKEAVFKVTKNRDFKTSHVRELKLVKTVKGKYGGTYLHNDLVIVFLRWLNADFAVLCDRYIREIIQQMHSDRLINKALATANKLNDEWLQVRAESKETRNELSEAIKVFCEYASGQRGCDYKNCPYYMQFSKMVYKSLNIKKPTGAKSVRDIYSGAVVEMIDCLESMLTKLIHDHISQGVEYHEAYKSIKELVAYEAMLINDEVA